MIFIKNHLEKVIEIANVKNAEGKSKTIEGKR